MKRVSALALGLAATLVVALPAIARDSLHIVGSSTVYPFSTTVTEALAKQGALKSPVVEATGTGGGFKLFCEWASGCNRDYMDGVATPLQLNRKPYELSFGAADF